MPFTFTRPHFNLVRFVTSVKYLYWLISIGAIVIVALLIFFLNQYLYNTIAQTEEIVLLRQEVAPEAINIKKFDAALQALHEKTAGAPTSNVKNPFAPPPTPVVQ